MGVKGFVEQAVLIVAVPALLGLGALVAFVSAGQVRPRARSAAYGGVWTGLLLVLGLVLALRGADFPTLHEPTSFVAVREVVAGVASGMFLTLAYLQWRQSLLVTAPLTILTVGALSALYLYLTWASAAAHIGWIALGIAASSTFSYAMGREHLPLRIAGSRVGKSTP